LDDRVLPWIQAWRLAMPTFYQREQPADHFRTGAHRDGLVPLALAEVVRRTAEALDAEPAGPRMIDVVDVGGGDGSLLEAVMSTLTRLDPQLAMRCRPMVVELRPRPPELSAVIGWIVGPAPDSVPRGLTGVLIAHELLDDVPLEVLQIDDAGRPREVLVDPTTGHEECGDVASDDAIEWCRAWWPSQSPGERLEVGLARDDVWTALTSRLERGLALAIDYAHAREERAVGQYPLGTLAGYRDGRAIPPIANGTMNVTAHVALDSCAEAAASRARAAGRECVTRFMTQREALTSLLPEESAIASDASARERLEAIGLRSHRAEAIDPAGLGGFTWLIQQFGVATRGDGPNVGVSGAAAPDTPTFGLVTHRGGTMRT